MEFRCAKHRGLHGQGNPWKTPGHVFYERRCSKRPSHQPVKQSSGGRKGSQRRVASAEEWFTVLVPRHPYGTTRRKGKTVRVFENRPRRDKAKGGRGGNPRAERATGAACLGTHRRT